MSENIPCIDAVDTTRCRSPITHYKTFVSPFIAKNLLQEFLTGVHVHAIDLWVAGHETPWISSLYHNLK